MDSTLDLQHIQDAIKKLQQKIQLMQVARLAAATTTTSNVDVQPATTFARTPGEAFLDSLPDSSITHRMRLILHK